MIASTLDVLDHEADQAFLRLDRHLALCPRCRGDEACERERQLLVRYADAEERVIEARLRSR